MTITRYVNGIASNRSDQFDAAILCNLTYETLKGSTGWDELRELVEHKKSLYSLSERTNSGAVDDAAFTAGEALYEVEDWVATLGVAEACRVVVEEVGTEWQDTWDSGEISDAKAEAKAWLRAHPEACESVGDGDLYPEVQDL